MSDIHQCQGNGSVEDMCLDLFCFVSIHLPFSFAQRRYIEFFILTEKVLK